MISLYGRGYSPSRRPYGQEVDQAVVKAERGHKTAFDRRVESPGVYDTKPFLFLRSWCWENKLECSPLPFFRLVSIFVGKTM